MDFNLLIFSSLVSYFVIFHCGKTHTTQNLPRRALKHSAQCISTFLPLFPHQHLLTLPSCGTETPPPYAVTPPLPRPWPHTLLSVPILVITPGTSCKWDHTLLVVCDQFTSLILMLPRLLHAAEAGARTSFLFKVE